MIHLVTFMSLVLSLFGCHICFAGASKSNYFPSMSYSLTHNKDKTQRVSLILVGHHDYSQV